MDGKKKLYVSVVSLVIFTIFVISTFSYAFFSANIINNGSLNVVTSISGRSGGVFTAYYTDNIHFNINAVNFMSGDGQVALGSSMYNVYYTGEPSTCTYDLVINNNGFLDNELKITISNNRQIIFDDFVQNFHGISQSLTATTYNPVSNIYDVSAALYSVSGVNQEHLISNPPTLSFGVNNVNCGV